LGTVVVLLLLVLAAIRAYIGIPPTMKGNVLPEKYNGKRFELVAMPVNHFGEKVRFCLDLLGVPFEETDNCGILNILVFGVSVPQLNDRKSLTHIGNSDECLRYLYGLYAATNPAAESLLKETEATMEWHTPLNDLGHAIQGWAYYYILAKDFSSEFSLVCWGGFDEKCPLLQRCIMQGGYALIKAFMRSALRLDSVKKRDERKAVIDKLLDRVDAAVGPEGKGYIVGDGLTYIDITFVSLMAPLLTSRILLKENGPWARGRFRSFAEAGKRRLQEKLPAELQVFERNFAERPSGKYVQRIFQEYRHKTL